MPQTRVITTQTVPPIFENKEFLVCFIKVSNMLDDEEEKLWNGLYIDVNGNRGTVTLTLSPRRNEATVSMLVYASHEAPPMIVWAAPLEEQNPMTGLQLKKLEDLPSGSRDWELILAASDPGAHARAALIGNYRVMTDGLNRDTPLSSGVIILWLFARQV